MSGPAPDVIVVGSGPAGVSAAWPLVEAGLSVLMLDAAEGPAPAPPSVRSPEAFRRDPEGWKARFGADLAGLDGAGTRSPKFATPAARQALDGYTDRLGITAEGFTVAGSLGRGGLSAIWGALAARFDASERANLPIPGDALEVSYAAVSRRIGLGTPAEPTSPVAARLLARHRRNPAGIRLEPAPNAVPARAQDGRAACTACGACLYGCAGGSIYASAQELPNLARHPNFRILGGHLVRSVEGDAGGHRLVCETRAGLRSHVAPRVVLAAGTVATTGLVLARLRLFGQAVRLLSNPTAAAAFVLPERLGAALPERAVSLGQLFYRLDEPGTGRSAGVLYGADALPLDLVAGRLPLSRPVALRLARALGPALVLASCYLPGAFSRNNLTLERGGLRLTGTQTPEARARLQRDLAQLRRALLRLGALPLPGSAAILPPGADAHTAGTLPMGGSGPLATTILGELAGAPGLYIADGAALPDLPATHPTLTIMANADRIGRALAARLVGTVGARAA